MYEAFSLRRRGVLRVFLSLALASALTASPALGAKQSSTNPVVANCENHQGVLVGHFSTAQLQAGYNAIPAAARQYTACAQVIENQLANQLGSKVSTTGSSSSGGSGSTVLIIAIVVIVLLGGGTAFLAYRRSRTTGP